MFDNMFFDLNRKIDSKSRLFLPSETGAIMGESIAIVNPLDRIYDLYLLSRINELVARLKEKVEKAYTKDQRDYFISELDALYGCVLKISEVDKQRRVALPMQMSIYENTSVHLIGRCDHIRIYPEDDLYNEYKQMSKKNNLFR